MGPRKLAERFDLTPVGAAVAKAMIMSMFVIAIVGIAATAVVFGVLAAAITLIVGLTALLFRAITNAIEMAASVLVDGAQMLIRRHGE